jgi:hypothetical protein
MIRFVLSLGILFSTTLVANAQQMGPREVRVQVSVNYSIPGPVGDSEDWMKAQESARKALYLVADRECTLLKETIASECRLESMNVNANRHRQTQQDMINVGSSMTFRVQLK